MSPETADGGGPRLRRTSLVLVVIGSLLLFLGGFAVWAARQALNTDDWVDTSSELLEDPEIQAAVQTFVVDSLFEAVDVKAELAAALPPRLAPLAGPAAGGLRELADRIAAQALESPKVQQLWADANRAAHEELIAVVEGGDGALSTEGGVVTLDLATIVEQIGARVGIDVAGKVPEQIGEVEVVQSDELSAAQDAADLLRKLAYGLILAALAVYGVAIWLARGRRRETVRAIGYGWIVVGIAILAVRKLAGEAIVEALADTASVEPAVDSTWRIGTSLLAASGAAVIGYGVIAVLGSALAGPTSAANATRRELAPLFHDRVAAYSALAVAVLLVFLWAPTEGTQRLAPSIVLLVLMVAGFEALRRNTVADYPEETWATAGPRWRERLSGVTSGLRSPTHEGRAADSREERIRQLERLEALRGSGVLSDEELAKEKTRIIGHEGSEE